MTGMDALADELTKLEVAFVLKQSRHSHPCLVYQRSREIEAAYKLMKRFCCG